MMPMEQLELPLDACRLAPRRKAKPIVKWAGGKAWIVPLASAGIYAYLGKTGGRYVEPFLGGGALALDLGLPGMILGDVIRPLVDMYDAVRRWPNAVAWALSALAAQGVDESSYYRVRDTNPSSRVAAAARFIYLNKLNFNGLYRENKQGVYNVPYGDQVYRKSIVGRKAHDAVENLFPSAQKLHALAEAFATSDLAVRDFRETLALAREGDLAYIDSPYYGTFASYASGGFTPEDQAALAGELQAAAERGVAILVTNSDCPEVRALYAWASIVIATSEARVISQDGAKRARAGCVIVTTDQTLLGT
jgi:DNA adenine methylase